jgi:hypothetical protein
MQNPVIYFVSELRSYSVDRKIYSSLLFLPSPTTFRLAHAHVNNKRKEWNVSGPTRIYPSSFLITCLTVSYVVEYLILFLARLRWG